MSSSNGWTNKLVKKGDYHTKIGEIKNKIASTTGLVKKTDYNAKTADIENKITDITDLIISPGFHRFSI